MTDVTAPPPETKDHLWANFDKLLVTFLLLVCGGIAVFLILRKADDAALQWAESLAGSTYRKIKNLCLRLVEALFRAEKRIIVEGGMQNSWTA